MLLGDSNELFGKGSDLHSIFCCAKSLKSPYLTLGSNTGFTIPEWYNDAYILRLHLLFCLHRQKDYGHPIRGDLARSQ